MTEASLHEAVCKYIKHQYPNVLFNSDMSGVNTSKRIGGYYKKLRSQKGWPDLMIFEVRGGFSGLFIEIKCEGEKLKKSEFVWRTPHIQEQAVVLEKLRQRNFMAVFAVGFDEAEKIIDKYLDLQKPD